jgi:hypothetical protein
MPYLGHEVTHYHNEHERHTNHANETDEEFVEGFIEDAHTA